MDRRRDQLGTMAATGVAAIVVAAIVPRQWAHHGPVLCPVMGLTGIPCPGCGLTRSFVDFMHGDIRGAFADHLFGPVLVVLIVMGAVEAGRRRWVRLPPFPMNRLVRHPATIVFAAGWLGYALLRAAGIG